MDGRRGVGREEEERTERCETGEVDGSRGEEEGVEGRRGETGRRGEGRDREERGGEEEIGCRERGDRKEGRDW